MWQNQGTMWMTRCIGSPGPSMRSRGKKVTHGGQPNTLQDLEIPYNVGECKKAGTKCGGQSK